jgi:hypothetical protein
MIKPWKMLAVVSSIVILVLVFIVFISLPVPPGPAPILTTKTKVSVLEQMIKKYQQKYGVYPVGSECSNGKVDNAKFLQAMAEWGLKQEDMTDAFGNPIIYYRIWDEKGDVVPLPDFPSKPLPDEVKNGDAKKIPAKLSYFIWSTGPDPSPGQTSDDIVRQG